MATALQRQLAAIAANSTHQLDLKAQKAQHSKSLLFDARDAATQNFDSIYQLCVEGFEELCHLDARFVPFSRNLFSEQSKSEDRTTMTAKENKELDTVLVRFMGLLGGRLLLKPAIKAAEWLVRRFRVHEYNTDVLLFTFLPYHSTPIFPTLLSILPQQLPGDFRFLHPYVSSLQSPPRHAIIGAASNKQSHFFTAFSHYVLNVAAARHQSALLVGFWASVTAQAVNGMIDASRSGREAVRRQNEEDLLIQVLPVLQSALSINGVPELYLGSCMIMTIMTAKMSLSEKVLDAMIEAVGRGWSEHTVEDGLVCMAVLAEEKYQVQLSRGTIQLLLKQEDVVAKIDRIGATYRVEKLLASVACSAVQEIARVQDPSAASLLSESLQSKMLGDGQKVQVLQAVVKSIPSLPMSEAGETGKALLLSVMSSSVTNEMLHIALANAEIQADQLGPDLVLRISDQPEQDSPEHHGAVKLDETISESNIQPPLALEDLSTIPHGASFLDYSNQSLFDEYFAIYKQALPSTRDLTALLDLPSLQKSACIEQPTILTFLARIWTSDAPASLRYKALRIASELLQASQSDGQLVYMQVLLPYAITSLADPVKAIRSGAASICSVLGELSKNISGQRKTSDDILVWGKSAVYGKQSLEVHWLAESDWQKFFFESLSPVLDDCVMDPDFAIRHLADIINGASTSARSADRKELRQSTRTSVYAFLASHVVLSPAQNVKLRLLEVVSKIGKAAGPYRTQILLPYAKRVLAKDDFSPQTQNLGTALVASLTHRSIEQVHFLKELAIQQTSHEQRLGFDRLRQLWPAFKLASQVELADWLVSLSLSSEYPGDVQSEAVETLRNLSLGSDVLTHLIETLPSVSQLQDQPAPAKKQRISRTSDAFKLGAVDKAKANVAIRRITLILELIEESKPEKHAQLLEGLFYLLSELHHYKTIMDSELVYLQGLLINNLLTVVNGIKNSSTKNVDQSVIRTDLIVECVRTTSSTQVHQAALLLMSALATWAPELVLHSVMPLFTFMSSTILKQGDDYSAHVTDQTVARIIPPLAASLKRRGKDLITGSAELLLSFITAFEHIPLHRRSALFHHLVQTLGAEESLFALVAMLIERYPEDASVVPFATDLMNQFHATIHLNALDQYIDLVFDTLKPKRSLSDIILGYSEKNPEQAAIATTVLLDGLSSTLVNDGFKKSLAKELKSRDDVAASLRGTYSTLLEKTMQLGLQLANNANGNLKDSASAALTALFGLMPVGDFIESSAIVMQTGSNDIRQIVFLSLEHRVYQAKSKDATLQKIFIDVLPNCAIFLSEDHPIETRIAAIACMDRITEKFGKTDRTAVMNIAQKIAGADGLGTGDAQSKLRRMSILCLASMVEVLEDEFIPILPNALDTIIRYMEAAVAEEDGAWTELLDAGFSFAMAVLDSIPWMLSGQYLARLVVLSSRIASSKAIEFSQLAAKKVSAHEFLTAVESTWPIIVEVATEEDVDAALIPIQALHEAIQHHAKATIASTAQLIFNILLSAFDLRRQLADVDTQEDLDSLFNLVNNTTMETVLKLNDASFRPFFIRFGEWATTGLPAKDRDGQILRCSSLYSFSLTLFEQLKSLVTNYASFLLENASTLLTSLAPPIGAEVQLLNLVLDALSSNFSHDQDGFWQAPAHYDGILEPLVSRLQLAAMLDANQHIIPAITELAAAVQSPEHHKSMNGMIMTYMRHENADVRLAAVKCERALTERLHIDWLNSLPEMLPFISELQEDDDGRVERETLRWIHQIEEVTGESLDSMLQ